MRLRRCSRRSIWLEMFTLSMQLQGCFPPKVAPFIGCGNYAGLNCLGWTRQFQPNIDCAAAFLSEGWTGWTGVLCIDTAGPPALPEGSNKRGVSIYPTFLQILCSPVVFRLDYPGPTYVQPSSNSARDLVAR